MHTRSIATAFVMVLLCAAGLAGCSTLPEANAAARSADTRQVVVTLNESVVTAAQTGRLFLLLTDRDDVEPRQVTLLTAAYYFNDENIMAYAPFFGQGIDAVPPGGSVVMSGQELGFPFRNLADIPPGTYQVQAILHRYEQVTPAHGKTIWLPMDDWEGSQFHQSPGNFYSPVKTVTVDANTGFRIELDLSQVIAPPEPPQDSEFVKHIKFRSELASKFWGRDIPVGINVVLPKGYFDHPEARYPVVFHMGHFLEAVPLHFPAEEPPPVEGAPPEQSPRWLWEGWMADDTPRFIAVSLLHPTPFYDDSYLVNSPNSGPWQDVFLEEMLPYLDAHFRTIAEPWARAEKPR